jgi:hypothetical protein
MPRRQSHMPKTRLPRARDAFDVCRCRELMPPLRDTSARLRTSAVMRRRKSGARRYDMPCRHYAAIIINISPPLFCRHAIITLFSLFAYFRHYYAAMPFDIADADAFRHFRRARCAAMPLLLSLLLLLILRHYYCFDSILLPFIDYDTDTPAATPLPRARSAPPLLIISPADHAIYAMRAMPYSPIFDAMPCHRHADTITPRYCRCHCRHYFTYFISAACRARHFTATLFDMMLFRLTPLPPPAPPPLPPFSAAAHAAFTFSSPPRHAATLIR